MGTMNIDGWDIDLCEKGLVALYVDVPVSKMTEVQGAAADGVQAIRLLKRELERLRAERWHQARHAAIHVAMLAAGVNDYAGVKTLQSVSREVAETSAAIADACHGKLP